MLREERVDRKTYGSPERRRMDRNFAYHYTIAGTSEDI